MKIFFCGDIAQAESKNADFIDDNLMKVISTCDHAICNFEGPLSIDENFRIEKAGPHLSQSNSVIPYLTDIGFDIFCLANNHAFDSGLTGLHKTIDRIVECSGKIMGCRRFPDSSGYDPLILEDDQLKIAVFNASEMQEGVDLLWGHDGLNWLFSSRLSSTIVKVKSEVDYCVLVAHAGLEHVDFPLFQWQDIYRGFCDIGIDVIIGHHPHVPQGYEFYNGSFIFYSLGNFFIDQLSFKDKDDDSFSLILDFKRENFDFQIIYHSKKSNVVYLANEDSISFNFSQLNSYLSSADELRTKSIEKSIIIYDAYLKKYLLSSVYGAGYRFVLNKILGRNRLNSPKLLEHLLKVETNRYVILNAKCE